MLFYPALVRITTNSKQYHRMQVYRTGRSTTMLGFPTSKEDSSPGKFRLEEINEMIALMEANQVQDGRMVIEFPW